MIMSRIVIMHNHRTESCLFSSLYRNIKDLIKTAVGVPVGIYRRTWFRWNWLEQTGPHEQYCLGSFLGSFTLKCHWKITIAWHSHVRLLFRFWHIMMEPQFINGDCIKIRSDRADSRRLRVSPLNWMCHRFWSFVNYRCKLEITL
jgi:hypothetical protein